VRATAPEVASAGAGAAGSDIDNMRSLVTLHLQGLNQDSQRRNATVQRLPQYELLFYNRVVERLGH
jgi:hypothetical protein